MTGERDILTIVSYLVVGVWLVFLALHVAREIALASRAKDPVERRAFRAFIARMGWRVAAAIVWAILVFGWNEDWPIVVENRLGTGIRYAGLVLAVSGIGLQSWARSVLGKYFSALLTTQPDHKVIKAGPYRWMRHPIYSGFTLMFIGLALSLNSWMFFWWMTVPQTALFVAQILYEEPMLIQKLGNEYRIYQQEVPALVPRIIPRRK